jgi:hypothetical protein
MTTSHTEATYRQTSQPLAPTALEPKPAGRYDLYPAFEVSAQSIHAGFDAIATQLLAAQPTTLRLDGDVGVFWSHFTARLDEALQRQGITARWLDVSEAMKDATAVDKLVEPCIGNDDPIFGTRFTGLLEELFDEAKLRSLNAAQDETCTILYGSGAALVNATGPIAFVEVPKNEVQYRSAAGEVVNLGMTMPADPKAQYKRLYFVDWPVMNQHKKEIVECVDWFIDEQHAASPALVSGDEVRRTLDRLSRNVFRPRPWFSPGPCIGIYTF